MPVSIDHVVVAVNDLDEAMADYRRLGFTVTAGGEHTHGASHNALIAFQNSSYIELIAFKSERGDVTHPWRDHLAKGEGFVDFAVASDDLIAEVAVLQSRGLPITGAQPGGRERTDGIRVEWRSARIDEIDGIRLPFIIEDITARNLRVAEGPDARHANGATGIERVTVLVKALERAAPAYRLLFGEQRVGGSVRKPGAIRFALRSQFVDLAEPDADDNDQTRFTSVRGFGLYEVALGGIIHSLPLYLAHQAPFVITKRG